MLELVIRVVFSLAVVFGLIWLVARTSTRKFGGAARSMVRVVARQPLARTASLAVVEVGDRVLVVGVSENGVSLLTEMDPDELPAREIAPEIAPATAAVAEAGAVLPTGARRLGPVLGAPRRGKRRADGPTGGIEGLAGTGLNGSVLSGQTWRQAWAAATSRNGAAGE